MPLANVKAAIASLTSLQRSVPQNNSGLSLSFQLQYAQTSPRQFQNCDLRGLIADATAQAQKIAGAGGFNATSIVGLDRAVSQPASACALTATFALGYSGHPGPPTITITASRIAISVTSGLSTGLDELSSAIAGAECIGRLCLIFPGSCHDCVFIVGPISTVLKYLFLTPTYVYLMNS